MKKSKRNIFRELNNRCFNNLRYKLQIFKKDIIKKIIASTMIITMSSTNMLYVFKSGYVYAANNIVNSKLYKDAKTNVNDVDVLMSLNNNVSNDNQTFNLVGNVKERNYLDIYIRVKDIGVLQGGVLELEILNKKSFKLEDYTLNSETDINNKAKQELKRQLDPQNIVEKVEGNKIYLNQIKKDNINENNTVNFKIPLVYSYEGNVTKENISNSFIAKFSAKYVSSNGKLYDVYKEQDLVINWVEEKNNTLNADIRKYIPIVTDQKQDKGNIILQTIVELENKGDGVNLPISKLELSSIMPAVNGKFPEKITSSILDTKSINEEEELTLKEDYLNYTKEDGRLKITLENKMSEDKSYVSGKGKTRVLLTSVYTNVDNISEITKKGFRAILDVNAKETLVSSNKEKTYNFKKDLVIKDKLGELVSFDMKLDKTNISKGIFYKNIYKEVKEKVSLKNTVALNVSSTDIVKGIRVKGQAPYYDNNTNLQEKNITVSKVEVSKTEFKNILGEDGSITINSNGKKLGEISKVTKEENGKYTFQLPEKVQSLEYVTSKTVNEGDLVLNEYYEMNSTAFNMEAFKKFQTLNFEKETFVQDLDGNGKTKGELSIKKLKNILKLDNTLTEINLKTNKEELSTVVKNENVEFVIQLNNDKLTSDIYGNTYFEMILPKELTNVEIKDSNIIYGEGLKLQSIKKEKVGQNIVLKIYVTGLQKEKNNGHLTNGTNIVINTDITIFEETPTKTVEYIVKYKNELATNSANVKKGTLKLKAPTGVVVANRVKNFNNSGNEVTTIKQGNKDATLELNGSAKQAQEQIMLINNLNQELKNAVILGRIPGPNTKDLKQNTDLGSNISTILTKGITNVNGRNDFDVYYSELVNANASLDAQNGWTKNPRDLKKVRSYMIVFKRNIKPQEVLKFNLNLEIPANLDYNKKAIIANSAMYRLEGQGDKYFASFADMIRLTTGEGVELQTSLNPEYEIAKQGEELTYLFTVKNVSKTVDAKNVQSYIDIPKGTVLEKIYTPKGEIPFSRDTEGRVKFNIDDIRTNEEQKIKVVLKVTEGYTKKELELKIRTKSDQIGKINEIVGKKVAIEKKLFNILVSKFEDETYDKIGEKEKLHYYVDLENLNNNDYRDLKLKFDTTNNVKIKKITIKKAPTLEGVTTSNSNKKDKNNQDKNQTSEFKRTLDNLNSMIGKQLTNQFDNKEDIIKEFNSNNAEVIIPLVQKYTTKGLILEIETQKLDKKVPHDPYIISMKLVEDKDNKEKLLATKDEKGFITKPIIDMKQTVSNSSTYIQEDEEIVYTYDITNFGSQELRYNKFKFVVPKNVGITNIKMYKNNQKYKEYDTGYIKYDGFEETFDLERASRYKIEIRVLIPKNIGVSKSTIKIFAELLDINSKLLAKTNEVTQIIEKGAESRALQQKVLKGEVNLSKSELRDLSIEDTIDKDTKIIRDFEIGGKAWIDTNKNGIYENTEKLLPYITVKLLDNDKKRIISTTETDKNGQYKFEKIPNGNYSVIFEYESEKYDTTIYKKNNLENNVSGAISSKITNGAEEKTIAVSDGININFQSKTGTDLGLKKKSEYDLSLKSKIVNIKLIDKNEIDSENPKVKKEYTINNIINDEVVSIFKNGLKENEALLVTYDVNIINEGTKESKIVSIKKSKRESEKIYDKNWSISNDIIQTKIPEKEQIIKPENTKTIQFKTIYTNEDFKNDGNVEEKFEILSAEYNGGVDADSTANNNIATEDDMSHNMLILDKSRYKNTIIILFSVIISLGITIIILNRFRKYSNKIKLK